MTYHQIGNNSNTTGATCGEGTVYPIGVHEFVLFLSVPSDYPFVAFKSIIMLSFFQRNTIFSIQLCDSPLKQKICKILVCIIARSFVAYPFFCFGFILIDLYVVSTLFS
jgi:hypothetical protein